ncbi:MAG: hypothetical protein IPK67_18455 [Planctomycetes bacterium]|nr:hypothetical protein [Planctomycetota bacterium]
MKSREGKISEALLAFAEPVLRQIPAGADPRVQQSVLNLAMLVWNAVILEFSGSSTDYMELAREAIHGGMSGLPEREALKVLAGLEARKRSEQPMDTRLIGEVKCSPGEDGTLRLRATCTAPRELSASAATTSKPNRGRKKLANASEGGVPRDFFERARDFCRLAPWQWMSDADVFAVEDPATGVANWCSVMGAGGETFGLAVYLGQEGYDVLQRTRSGESFQDEAAFGQPALVLMFVDRGELSKECSALIRRSGVVFRGRGAHPLIESHAANRIPRAPTDAELRTMTSTLIVASVVCRLSAVIPEPLLPDEQGRLSLSKYAPGLAEDDVTFDRIAPPAPPQRTLPAIDTEAVFRLRRETSIVAMEIECDLFPALAIIQERGVEPYVKSGRVLCCELGHPKDRDAHAQEQFLKLLDTLKARPSVVYLRRPSLEQVLRPICKLLGIRLEQVAELRTLDPAREALDQFSTRAGGGR